MPDELAAEGERARSISDEFPVEKLDKAGYFDFPKFAEFGSAGSGEGPSADYSAAGGEGWPGGAMGAAPMFSEEDYFASGIGDLLTNSMDLDGPSARLWLPVSRRALVSLTGTSLSRPGAHTPFFTDCSVLPLPGSPAAPRLSRTPTARRQATTSLPLATWRSTCSTPSTATPTRS